MLRVLTSIMTIKLYKYKDHAEKFVERFKDCKNISFKVCETYEELMQDSDVIISSVTYISEDFCSASFYKDGCTVIPVHLALTKMRHKG